MTPSNINDTILPVEFPSKSYRNNFKIVIENSTKEAMRRLFIVNFIPTTISAKANKAQTTGNTDFTATP